MAWQDRDYYRDGGAGDYLSNPASILAFSIPFGTWFGVRVRLHFWLLLTIAFGLIDVLGHVRIDLILAGVGLLLVALLVHDFSHRGFAQLVNGRLDEFMFWPAGGMIFPTVPPGPWPMFVAYGGAILVHAALAIGCLLAARFPLSELPLNPIGGLYFQTFPVASWTAPSLLFAFGIINWFLVLVNLLPYFWFDGGFIYQSILWGMTSSAKAITVVCFAGMILAVPMFVMSLQRHDFLGMVVWVFLFSGSYTRWRDVQASGAGVQESMGYEPDEKPKRRWLAPDFSQRAAAARREQQKIDKILAKVSEKGMQSLTWREKRMLRKATERQQKASEWRGD